MSKRTRILDEMERDSAAFEKRVAAKQDWPKSQVGYGKPKRSGPMWALAIFGVVVLLSIAVRLLSAPDGGPIMAAYHFIAGLFGK